MKALVYHCPGKRALEDKPKPVLKAPPMPSSRSPRRPFVERIFISWKVTCQPLRRAEFWGTKMSESSI